MLDSPVPSRIRSTTGPTEVIAAGRFAATSTVSAASSGVRVLAVGSTITNVSADAPGIRRAVRAWETRPVHG